MDLAEPVAEVTEAEPDGYVCPPCQRGKHARCRVPECTCCGEDQEQ